ncbi:MAG: site-specific tyrosine recombinase XerC [Syntrophorhabdus sp. PtaB.Bin047]|nr:MAG: site-specific tyrosine recombinase XerC [Syntrophorhabdus sp. PtaB.Bin047]
MALMGKGTLLCSRCKKRMVADACKCGSIHCFIRYYHGGRFNRMYDQYGARLTYVEATRLLIDLNKLLENDRRGIKPFDPAKWSDQEIAENRFANRYKEFVAYMERRLNLGKITLEHYRHVKAYGNHFSFFERYNVADLDTGIIDDFIMQLPLKSKTQRNIVGTLHRFLEWLVERGKLATMPAFPSIEGGDETLRKALRKQEQLNAIEALPSEHRDVIRFMMETGLRPSEAIAILIKSVDQINRCAWIERRKTGKDYENTTKNRQKLSIPLNSVAWEIAQRQAGGRPGDELLFIHQGTGKGYTGWFLSDLWRAKSQTAVCLYEATRHSFCSQIVPLTDPFTAQRLMRHKDKRSTERYYHADSDRLHDVVEAISVTHIEHKNRGSQ